MTGREVEDSEERLILVGAVSPMSFPSTFIPYLTFLAEVVIFFGVVRAVIRAHAGTRDTSCTRMASWSCWRMCSEPVEGIHARDDRCAGGSDTGALERARVDHALFAKASRLGGGIIVP